MKMTRDIARLLLNTKAVNEEGTPKLLYRGEFGLKAQAKPQLEAQNCIVSFGSCEVGNDYACAFGREEQPMLARVYPVYLNITKPFVNDPDDPYVDYTQLVSLLGEKDAKHFFLKHQETAMSNGNWLNKVNYPEQFKDIRDLAERAPERLNELYIHVFALMEDAKFVRLLKDAGYDGAITCTDTDHEDTAEYWVFDPSAVVFALTGERCQQFKKHRKEKTLAADAQKEVE